MTSHYAGLDVSLHETSICIVDQAGAILREGAVPTDPRSIAKFLRVSGRKKVKRIGMEAGNLSGWLCHALSAARWPVFCLETRHTKAALKAQSMKTDRNDARGLAQITRTGWFRSVHVKSVESQKLRVLLNNRRCLLDKRLDVESQIRGTLKVFGLKAPPGARSSFEERVRKLIRKDSELALYMGPLLEARRHMLEQFRKLDAAIRAIAKHDPVCGRFMMIPGVGPMTALAYKTSIDRPERFRRSRDVGAALGLTPRKYASGNTDYDGRITRKGDAMAREHLYEAAIVLLTRTKAESALKAWGTKIARRGSTKKACVAVARKLAVIMHRMWLDGSEFRSAEAPDGISPRNRAEIPGPEGHDFPYRQSHAIDEECPTGRTGTRTATRL